MRENSRGKRAAVCSRIYEAHTAARKVSEHSRHKRRDPKRAIAPDALFFKLSSDTALLFFRA